MDEKEIIQELIKALDEGEKIWTLKLSFLLKLASKPEILEKVIKNLFPEMHSSSNYSVMVLHKSEANLIKYMRKIEYGKIREITIHGGLPTDIFIEEGGDLKRIRCKVEKIEREEGEG